MADRAGIERGLFNRLLIGNVKLEHGEAEGRGGRRVETSTATTRQMAIGQRDLVAKFANRGNNFNFVLENC